MATVPGQADNRSAPLALIFTADDFGRDEAINRAARRAHQEGVLTAASLMVAEAACNQAVAMAKAAPTLAVGLHVVAIDGASVLGHKALPHITRPDGRFPADSYGLGARYFFSRVAREELARELEAQFERFAETGLSLAHADGHYHMHMHPMILPIFLRLAETFGARGFRLPNDDLRIALNYNRSRLALNLLWGFYYAALLRWGRKIVAASPLARTDRVYGLFQTGRMTEDALLHLVKNIPPEVRTAEIYCHPSERDLGEPGGPNPGDLATLLSPRVREALDAMGARRVSYRDLTCDAPQSCVAHERLPGGGG